MFFFKIYTYRYSAKGTVTASITKVSGGMSYPLLGVRHLRSSLNGSCDCKPFSEEQTQMRSPRDMT